ncbi:hypothetical protein SAMN04488072_101437 [Lentibacillus halodurans]|uniref:Thiamine-phosphate pyrophosphorylase n=1 Tax=Lentibacillus halodurans TaxID=237679 RepID=A0A1I0VJ14_9BACI|nr:hypothetical protein [Lentibacillus halodurans]SFA76023.1 hypothetical protein SAMN04488072_101437 [Lentibacillus halodurans]
MSLKELLNEKDFSLIVSLPSNDIETAKAAIAGGADALKIHLNVEHRASGNTFGSLKDNLAFFEQLVKEFNGPLGIVPGGNLENINKDELKSLEKLGFDYYSVYMKHMPSFMLDLELEKTVAGDSSYSIDTLKAMNCSAMDAFEASIVPGEKYGTALNFEDLLNYRLIVDALDIPVIVPSQRKITSSDIPHLKSTGVKALMIGAVVTGDDVKSIEEATKTLKKSI